MSTVDPRYATFLGKAPRKMTHWEHWSCPDAESYLAGIDYYAHPRQCRLRLKERYPQLNLPVPESDAPLPKPSLDGLDQSANLEKHTVRWGDAETATFLHGEAFFREPEDVFRFSPLEHANFTCWEHVVMNWDFSSEEVIYQRLRQNYPLEWGDQPPPGQAVETSFYNTMFMWPLLTFGWEMFLACCLDARFERIMDEFAEINRRVFAAFSRLPVRFVICHDDIVMSSGQVCSRRWMHRYIFPRYEEFWGMLKAAGKDVIFMSDGCMDPFVDDVMACGALGIISEPYTNYKSIARRYPDCFIAGEGDNRILQRNNPVEIRSMVDAMIETGRLSGGYMLCIGNHIPWNVPPEAIKHYLDYADQAAFR